MKTHQKSQQPVARFIASIQKREFAWEFFEDGTAHVIDVDGFQKRYNWPKKERNRILFLPNNRRWADQACAFVFSTTVPLKWLRDLRSYYSLATRAEPDPATLQFKDSDIERFGRLHADLHRKLMGRFFEDVNHLLREPIPEASDCEKLAV